MKVISNELKSHLANEVTTLANCWKITRRDKVVLGFTDHDEDILYDGINYLAYSGFTPSAVADNSELAVDNLDVEGIINSDFIKDKDLQSGLYDFAEVEIFMLNYNDLSQGSIKLRQGWVGEVSFGKSAFKAEIRGLMQSFSQKIGQIYSPSCRANLGDVKCGVDLAGFTVSGTITSVESNRVFEDNSRNEEAGWFSLGFLSFTSGNNSGLSMEIKSFGNNKIELVLPMAYQVQVGDNYSMIVGCDKTLSTCKDKFSNVVNFRGEPHIPGLDQMLQTAGTIG